VIGKAGRQAARRVKQKKAACHLTLLSLADALNPFFCHGNTWKHMETQMETHGNTWKQMGTSWKHMETHGNSEQ
jgi:hypothetical protein